MGAADVVPGVSGGTMALILGIYPRFIGALSRIDVQLVKEVALFPLKRDTQALLAALRRADVFFLLALGLGIGVAFVSLARVIPWLITNFPAQMNGFFFGMILASIVIPYKIMQRRGPFEGLAFVAAAAFAYWVTGLELLNLPASLPFLYACGAIAISAMLLPGLSGSFLLLILGQYEYMLRALKDLTTFSPPQMVAALPVVLVFGAGMATGLLGFSRFLRWLLARFPNPTMAALIGLMVGSLRKIWPFKLAPEAPRYVGEKMVSYMPNVFPTDPAYSGPVLTPLLLMLVGLVAVLVLNWLGTKATGRTEIA